MLCHSVPCCATPCHAVPLRAMLCHATLSMPRHPAVSCCVQEADILHRLGGSPHVVALHGACVVDQHMVVVMELMQVGFRDTCGPLFSSGAMV